MRVCKKVAIRGAIGVPGGSCEVGREVITTFVMRGCKVTTGVVTLF